MNELARRLTQHELSQDPDDFVARNLLHTTADLSHARVFGAVYLLSHGIVKIVLVVALLRTHRWAYPATLAFLGAFITYQAYRLTVSPNLGLWALTVFDLIVLALVWREYQVRRPLFNDKGHP